MQTNGNIITNQRIPSPTQAWESAQGWARRWLRRDVILEAALALVALEAVAFVLLSLKRAFADYTMTGF